MERFIRLFVVFFTVFLGTIVSAQETVREITVDFDDVNKGAVADAAEVKIESASLEFREIGSNLGKALNQLGDFSDVKIVYYKKEGTAPTERIATSYVADVVKNHKISDIGNENNARKLMWMINTDNSAASINIRYTNGIKGKVFISRENGALSGIVIFPEVNGKKQISIFNLNK